MQVYPKSWETTTKNLKQIVMQKMLQFHSKDKQRNLTEGKYRNKQQFRFDALRSQDAENAIGVFKADGKLGGGSKV